MLEDIRPAIGRKVPGAPGSEVPLASFGSAAGFVHAFNELEEASRRCPASRDPLGFMSFYCRASGRLCSRLRQLRAGEFDREAGAFCKLRRGITVTDSWYARSCVPPRNRSECRLGLEPPGFEALFPRIQNVGDRLIP